METVESSRLSLLSAQSQLSKERKAREVAEKDLRAVQEELQTIKAKYQQEIEEMKGDLEVLKAESAYTVDLRKRFKGLEARVKELEGEAEIRDKFKTELESKEALYQVGKNIRRRFLEQAREPILGHFQRFLDQATIERGNAAAHGGNGEADATLLLQTSGEAGAGKLLEVFESLYLSNPIAYVEYKDPKIREAINCQATIRTLKSLNSGMNRPLKEKQAALENFEIIMEKHRKAEITGGESEDATREDLERRISLVKEFTAKIVEYDRRRIDKAEKNMVSGEELSS